MDKKEKKENKINFTIKNEDDLNRVLELLEEQGFGYNRSWELHQRKVQDIINKSNKLNIKYDNKLLSDNTKLKDYSEIEKNVKKYFSKFNSDDKINEFLNVFYIQSDATARTPYSSPNVKEVVDWVNFKKRFNVSDEFGRGNYIEVYLLDKKGIKIKFGEYKTRDFKIFYNLVYNEECPDFDQNNVGDWQDLGRIEIKFFQNGNAAIKGEVKKLKEYYYNYIKNFRSGNYIIRYNNKTEIIKKNLN